MKETRMLPVELTEPEWKERAEELAQVCESIDKAKAAQKEMAAEFKRNIEAKDYRRAALQIQVRDYKEYRDVSCKWEEDAPHQTMILFREDTGEEVTRRTMTADELQTVLPLDTTEVFEEVAERFNEENGPDVTATVIRGKRKG